MRRRADQRDSRLCVPQTRDQLGHFVAGKLAAFSGLGALRDLDLQFLGMCQVFSGNPEAARSNLLDLVVARQKIGRSVRLAAVRIGIFAAFAGIGAAAQLVHGEGDGFVRLGTDASRETWRWRRNAAPGWTSARLDRRTTADRRNGSPASLAARPARVHFPRPRKQTMLQRAKAPLPRLGRLPSRRRQPFEAGASVAVPKCAVRLLHRDGIAPSRSPAVRSYSARLPTRREWQLRSRRIRVLPAAMEFRGSSVRPPPRRVRECRTVAPLDNCRGRRFPSSTSLWPSPDCKALSIPASPSSPASARAVCNASQGQTAPAPYPMSTAAWCRSRQSPASRARPTLVRKPALTSA